MPQPPLPEAHSHYRKRWGAEPVDDARFSFRLWAPGVDAVSLVLEGHAHGMDRDARGWFETELRAAAGQSYEYRLPGGLAVPDPASRAQTQGAHGPSLLVDPRVFEWQTKWTGRPWHETVHYEAHVGTFSPEGTFEGMLRRLDHLASLGITALELCPVTQFGGERGWGYDGVLLYAPHRAYGTPNQLKRLVDAAHARGLMVFLDAVYNHLGPDGNYLASYAPTFFHPERRTPWGDAIAYDQEEVRAFYIDNALYWLDEYRIDGLRLDAVDHIDDMSDEPILQEIASAVRSHGFAYERHLTSEDDRNITLLHERRADGTTPLFDGEWNDDFHHVAHVLATRETEFYYFDFAADPRAALLKAMTSGFVFQGEPSAFRGGKPRGQPSAHLPPVAFVNFLQNHDQVGNRGMSERLSVLAPTEALEVLNAILLLMPCVPLLFMGDEWAETRPFFFFSDFEGELAKVVREGRRDGMQSWPAFADPALRASIPDPNDAQTFERSKLDWSCMHEAAGAKRLQLIRTLLAVRHRELVPRLAGVRSMQGEARVHGTHGIEVSWVLADGAPLTIVANLGGAPFGLPRCAGRELFAIGDRDSSPWSLRATLADAPHA